MKIRNVDLKELKEVESVIYHMQIGAIIVNSRVLSELRGKLAEVISNIENETETEVTKKFDITEDLTELFEIPHLEDYVDGVGECVEPQYVLKRLMQRGDILDYKFSNDLDNCSFNSVCENREFVTVTYLED